MRVCTMPPFFVQYADASGSLTTLAALAAETLAMKKPAAAMASASRIDRKFIVLPLRLFRAPGRASEAPHCILSRHRQKASRFAGWIKAPAAQSGGGRRRALQTGSAHSGLDRQERRICTRRQ